MKMDDLSRKAGLKTGNPVNPITCHTCKLTDAQAGALENYLRDNGYSFREVPYARFAADKEKTNLVFYQSGKLVVQGKGTQDFVEFVLEPLILQEVKLGYETVLAPGVARAAHRRGRKWQRGFLRPALRRGRLYQRIGRRRVEGRWHPRFQEHLQRPAHCRSWPKLFVTPRAASTAVVPIGNEAYNRLFLKLRSVNAMLAWGHARVIENLMGRSYQMNPPPVRAISDQFAHDKATVATALMRMGRSIELVQRHKAEEDLAVAAASILARNEFVTRLAALGKRFEVTFPKGASAAVDAAAKEFVAKYGAEKLNEVAKTHFRTALRAQGLPEPPKKEWRRPRPKSPNP